MTDLKALEDAFAELERRADNAAPRPESSRSRIPRLVPVAAALVVAAGLATGIAALSTGDEAPARVPVGTQPNETTKLPVHKFTIPTKPEDLAARFRTVLDGAATFTVTDTGSPVEFDDKGNVLPGAGTAIVGVLTAGGVSGGYDIQIIRGEPGIAGAHCDDPDLSHCKLTTRPDGSSLAVGSEPLQNNPKGRTYQVDLVRKDGTEFLMHVSNERDPKGASELLAPKPPLTTDQMVDIVTSEKW